MANQDPVVSAMFGIEFQNQIQGSFRECTGLGSELPAGDDGGDVPCDGRGRQHRHLRGRQPTRHPAGFP